MKIKKPYETIKDDLAVVQNKLELLLTEVNSDNKDIEIQNNGSHLQWKYKENESWTDLIDISSLKGERGEQGIAGQNGIQGQDGVAGRDGADGKNGINGSDGKDGKDGKDAQEIELRKTDTHIQWKRENEKKWRNLIALEELRGPKGKDGANGSHGGQGLPGVGVPNGGTTNQVLSKASDLNYDTQWVDQTGGGGSTPESELSYHDAWAAVQKSVHFRADEISTLLTNAERVAIGATYPDGPMAFVTVDSTVYVFGNVGNGAFAPLSQIRRNTCTVGDTLAINNDTLVCVISGAPSEIDYFGGGPIYVDGSRLVMFAHTEDGVTLSGCVLTSTDAGANWDYVGTVFGSTYEVQAFVFDPNNDNIYYYLNGNSQTIIAKTTKTEMTAYAAGGSAPTVTYWDGTAWVSGEGNAMPIADDTVVRDNEPAMPTVADVCFVPQVNKYLAVAHKGGGDVTDPYNLSGYIIDVEEPWNLKKLDFNLYRDLGDRQNSGGDEPSNIGYVSLVAPDRQAVLTNAFIDLIRVDAEDPDPGQPWDDTILTQVRLRPTVDKRDVIPIELDRVVYVFGGFTGTSAVDNPSFSAVTLNDNDDVMAYDFSTSSGWWRYTVQSTGDWILSSEQPTGNDLLQAPANIGGLDVNSLYNIYLNPSTGLPDLQRSVQIANNDWIQTQANIASSVFVYKPSGTASGKIYTDWNQLQQICSLNPEVTKTIIFIGSASNGGGTINLDFDATYNHDGQVWVGNGNPGLQGGVNVIFGDDATTNQYNISSWINPLITGGLRLINKCPAPIHNVTGAWRIVIEEQAMLEAITSPMFEVTVGDFSQVIPVVKGGVMRRPFGTPSSITWSGGTMTIQFPGQYDLTNDYIGELVTISGATFTGTDPNGSHVIDSFTSTDILVTAPDPGTVGGTVVVRVGAEVFYINDGGGGMVMPVVFASGLGQSQVYPDTIGSDVSGFNILFAVLQGVQGNGNGASQGVPAFISSQSTGTFGSSGVLAQTHAHNLGYDNTSSGLTATDTQAAIDELASSGGGGGTEVYWELIGDGVSTTIDVATGLTASASGYAYQVQLRDYAVDGREMPIGSVIDQGSGNVTYVGNSIPSSDTIRFEFSGTAPNSNGIIAIITAVMEPL